MQNEVTRTALTSMEVAEMVDKKHADLLKDIRRYNNQLAEGNIPSGNFLKRTKKLCCYLPYLK